MVISELYTCKFFMLQPLFVMYFLAAAFPPLDLYQQMGIVILQKVAVVVKTSALQINTVIM